ncbi:MAG: sulfatase-like hydrolase/transferase [Pseudomonadales bacterium]|nr:sulfatase-like hydrolase/transferase [Pseudomonadales bacterium]
MNKKKVLLSVGGVLILITGVLWVNRIELLLTFVEQRASAKLSQPYREVAWQQGPAKAAPATTGRPPNIVFILGDDMGYNDISTFGGGIAGGAIKTPSIDELASQGAVYEQSYAGNATCAPSRAMLMTGRYPTRTGFEFTPTPAGMAPVITMISGAMNNGLPPVATNQSELAGEIPDFEMQGLPSSEVTIAEVLKARGYYTAHIGKWHLGRGPGFTPNDQGFDDSLLMESLLYLPKDHPDVVNAPLSFDPIDKFLWASSRYSASFNSGGLTEAERFMPGGYLTDYWTDEAVKVIRANKHRPFFLYLAHWGVHSPLQATKEDYEAVGDLKPHRLRVYAAMMRALDRSVGKINQTLEEEGLADNTIVVFSSDNGGPGYIGLPDINSPFRGWKLTNFEGGLRVPLFIKWPGKIAPGTRVNKPVAHIDLMPTLAAAAGAALPQGLQIDGVNVVPLATGEAGPAWHRDTLFWQSGHYRVVRQGDWKLQVSENPKKSWLYNLAEDPTEQINRASDAPEKLRELSSLLAAHQASARPPLYPYVSELPVAVDKTLAEMATEGDEVIFWPN